MRRRPKIVISAIFVFLVLLGVWIFFSATHGKGDIGVGYTIVRGHFPEPGRIYADRIFVVWVTNTGHSTIGLGLPKYQYLIPDGRVVTDMGSSWNLMSYGTTLSPGGV